MARRGYTRLLGRASMFVMVLPSVAYAQEQGLALDDIIVTAQKRTENLQATPLAISAVTSATLEKRGIADVSTLTAVAPSLSVTVTGASTSNIALFIRGIGESETILTVDSPVGLYVDGIVLGRSSGAVFDLVDLERVEVLRGPQGTLYGRNTIGGAVNLISKAPAREFGVDQSLSYGRFDFIQSKTTVDSGELGSSGIRAKLTYLHKQRDGYTDNILAQDSRDPGAYNVEAFRAAVAYDQGLGVRVDYAFDYNERKSVANPSQLAIVRDDVATFLSYSKQLGGSAPQVSRDRLNRMTLDNDGVILDKVQGHTLKVEVDLAENLTFRSLTGYRKWANTVVADYDGNGGLVGFVADPVLFVDGTFIPVGVRPVSLYHLEFDRGQHQWTQEFNLIGKIGERTDFVLGAFHFNERAREENPTYLTYILPADAPIPVAPDLSVDYFGVNLASNFQYLYKSRSQALFGQVTTELTDRFSVTGGLRYTKDIKELNQTIPYDRDLKRSFDQVNWAVTLDYTLSDHVMTYARVATGYKAGGFNARSVNDGFRPEDLISYEIGVKSELLDRRLRLNAAVYHAVHKDVQVGQFLAGSGGSLGITVNAGKAAYSGIEAEFVALLTDALTISGNIGYINRKYKAFELLNPATNQMVDVADEARFIYSPNTTGNIAAEYRFPPLSFGELAARLDYSYRSRMYWHPTTLLNPYNDAISDKGVGRLDGRLSLSDVTIGTTDAQFSVWVKNITNENYLLGGVEFGSLGFATVGYAEPRTWGIDMRVRF